MLARAEEGRGSYRGSQVGSALGHWEGAGRAALGEEAKGVPWPQSPGPDHSRSGSQDCFVSLWGFLGIPTSEPRMLDKGHQEPARLCRARQREQQVGNAPSDRCWEGRARGDLGTSGKPSRIGSALKDGV